MDKKWSSEKIFESITSIDNLVTTLTVLNTLKDVKYKDNKSIDDTIDIIRNYVCGLFGGSINEKN